MNKIPTFVINLEKRKERKAHIIKQFNKRTEFNVHIVKAIENKNGALGLWQTITQIVQQANQRQDEYILICEDDHEFMDHYNKEAFFYVIKTCGQKKEADILLGGVSWFYDALRIDRNLYWIDKFTGTQFIIIFRKFYDAILGYEFKNGDTADKIIYELTDNNFLIYPYISTQKEFGYSDATVDNNAEGRVTKLFDESMAVIDNLDKVNQFYK
ncbi:glycosyltransferase family 25 protein [uncultured Pedobacter sp.]|uniref:glycosyltransferase family 25 protein n=1 Tax=uncultured Pedobacter sp. TaxID=246139 RepID=UPI0025E36BF5|nr:glycosyltransferase family 25 protein [uncultured Pedobacter sp.]